MFFDGLKTIQELKDEVRNIMKQHFKDIASAEAKVHELGKQLIEQRMMLERQMAEQVDTKNREIVALKHAIALREEGMKLDLEKIKVQHERELDASKAEFKDEKYEEMKKVLMMRADAHEKLLSHQERMMATIIMKLPENVSSRTILEGTPPDTVLRIEDNSKGKKEE